MNTEKLTIEHLAFYLPYGLNFTFKNLNGDLSTPQEMGELNVVTKRVNEKYFVEGEVLPILRPMSDLKQSDVDESPYQSKDELYGQVLLKCVPIYVWDKLIKQYFDVFDLIEKGLAISIHDIKK